MTTPTGKSSASKVEGDIPASFIGYVRSMGPGIITVLTWLSAGDIVGSATAGGNYGYALMWAFALCLLIRCLFVSLIAKYQLCNQRGESVLAALARLHPWFAPLLLVCTLALAHAIGVFLLAGAGDVCVKLSGVGTVRLWAPVLALLTLVIVFRPAYRFIEKIFFVLAGLLTVTFVSLAIQSKPSVTGIAKGVFGFALPEATGRFDPVLVMVALVGAVGGGLGNLMYPYFIREKGWTTPAHRRVQQYDLFFSILVLIMLDLSVWILGVETLFAENRTVTDMSSLAQLLGSSFGEWGATIFYLGIFAAIFSSMIGNSNAYGYLAVDAYQQSRAATPAHAGKDYKNHPLYRWFVVWIILSPLVWVMVGRPDFVGLSLLVNSAQVILIPVLVVGIWLITARAEYIGVRYRNKLWENVFVGLLLLIGCISAYFSAASIIRQLIGN